MTRFRRKPIFVEAEQFHSDKKPWPFGVDWEPEFRDQDGSRLGGFFKLRTYGGFQFITSGDWVVQRADGKREVIAREVFDTIYEPCDGKILEG